ncbi:phosphoenolpyruvate hydrolase family protein [Shimia sp. R10_1]|uniref:phosphoenolpyruvate hydrolase family protein n=1 Tax=Shimia sp. R10_1 TaxID=2821095 RepID=UPI001ADA9641|nr:phosphoenolpyruvate hydrolase family protein [Shimia sp. R10_1]MBO9475217.1 phosphoenolpyruvate hydrolase family protein [Shimia sp. R10_1]
MSAQKKEFLFAAVVGSGLTAKAADKAGADYLLALNAGRFRVQGASSLTSFLPVRAANDWVIEFAEREMLGRCSAPIYAGFSVSDPNLDIAALVARTKALGFAGVCNFPSTTLIDGRLGALLEREGLGLERELTLVREATKAGLGSFAYVHNNMQARKMVDAGATAICVNVGFTSGGTGVTTHLTLDTAAAQIERVLEGVPASVDKLCHGGPITSPEEALAITRICGVQGFVAGSTLDRLPVEQTLNEVTKGFTAIPSLSRVETSTPASRHDLVGSSMAMQMIRQELEELAHEDVPVLLIGETGTGKSRAALGLHEAGMAARRQPVVVDCPALNGEEGAVHLLGKAPGAFGGGGTQRGALELAAGSTIIFDEISALPRDLQGKLLKFTDEKVVQRIGDHSARQIDARIIATNALDLLSCVDTQDFRQDLFYRISGYEITLPPLRARVDDIPELAMHLGQQIGGEVPKFSNAALRRLLEHDWPGNVRELAHAVHRAIRRADGRTVDLKAVDFLRRQPVETPAPETPEAPTATSTSEREWIAAALSRNGFRRAQTAEELGMTTRTLYNKIKKYHLQA